MTTRLKKVCQYLSQSFACQPRLGRAQFFWGGVFCCSLFTSAYVQGADLNERSVLKKKVSVTEQSQKKKAAELEPAKLKGGTETPLAKKVEPSEGPTLPLLQEALKAKKEAASRPQKNRADIEPGVVTPAPATPAGPGTGPNSNYGTLPALTRPVQVAPESGGRPVVPLASGLMLSPNQKMANAFAALIEEAIPREYERKKDWGKTKRITVGLETEGGRWFRIRRQRKEVEHGTWKHYRIKMIEPEKNLVIKMKDLHQVKSGQMAFTLTLSTKVEAWVQARIYNRGVHVITVTSEGTTEVHLELNCELAIEMLPDTTTLGLQVVPVVVGSAVQFNDFKLTRVGEIKGKVARELGRGLRSLLEEELNDGTLTKKLNRAIQKKKKRLRFTPDGLVGSVWRPLSVEAEDEREEAQRAAEALKEE